MAAKKKTTKKKKTTTTAATTSSDAESTIGVTLRDLAKKLKPELNKPLADTNS